MGFWRIVFTIILPPLGVLLGKGFGWAFILNIVLTLLGYIPGLIHAFGYRRVINSFQLRRFGAVFFGPLSPLLHFWVLIVNYRGGYGTLQFCKRCG